MTSANVTIRDALSHAIDPATPKFVQPPIFRPASDSPSAFLLGYERAAIGNGWTDNYKILYLGQFLEGPAHKWYQRYLSYNGNATKNWEAIKRDLKTEFMEDQQQGPPSNRFYHKKQSFNEEIKHYYYDLLSLADEVNLNMPFTDFQAQFEKGLHPKFRQLYYILRNDEMNQNTLKNIIQKLHRSQEALSDDPRTNNYFPRNNKTSNNFNRRNIDFPNNNRHNRQYSPHQSFRTENTTTPVRSPQEVVLHTQGSKILNVKGIINNKYTEIILDTGAGRSIITENLSHNTTKSHNANQVTGAGGQKLQIIGTNMAKIEFGTFKINMEVLVAQYLSRPAILGNDFLEKTEATIDYHQRKVTFNPNNAIIYERNNKPKFGIENVINIANKNYTKCTRSSNKMSSNATGIVTNYSIVKARTMSYQLRSH
ncbi:hypothetical protein ABEB36_010670 [Hypothenemus hampei]|uniref:Peptidase A2 domain-containing protein n=1 Tax=Hypothenemus hampei TaxID=57062 RepID=A0ABD1ED12_HYPHA